MHSAIPAASSDTPAPSLAHLAPILRIATALWLPAGYSVREWIEHAGSYAAPFAAGLLIRAGAETSRRPVPGVEPPDTSSVLVENAPSSGASVRDRGALTLLVAALLALAEPAAAQLPPPDAALLDQLRRGGHVLVCRHAITDHSPQAPTARNRDPLLARPLNDEGEAQAEEIGRLLRALRIPVADVHASPYARTLRSAALTFGEPRAEPVLQSSAAAERRRPLLTDPVAAGGNRTLVTHQRVLYSDLGLARGTAPEGFCAVVRPDMEGGFRVVAGAMPDDWARLLPRDGVEIRR
jgi:hypothetical protein